MLARSLVCDTIDSASVASAVSNSTDNLMTGLIESEPLALATGVESVATQKYEKRSNT